MAEGHDLWRSWWKAEEPNIVRAAWATQHGQRRRPARAGLGLIWGSMNGTLIGPLKRSTPIQTLPEQWMCSATS
jgi:hypothetical protein